MMFFCHSDLILTRNERNEWDEYDHFSYRENFPGNGSCQRQSAKRMRSKNVTEAGPEQLFRFFGYSKIKELNMVRYHHHHRHRHRQKHSHSHSNHHQRKQSNIKVLRNLVT